MQARLHTPFHWLMQLHWSVDTNQCNADLEDNAFLQLQKYGLSTDHVLRFVYEGRGPSDSTTMANIIQFPITQHTKEV